MTIHPAPYPIIASAPLTEAQASTKELLFFGLVNRGFWLARRGMLTVSLPVTDEMARELVAAFAEVVASIGRRSPDRGNLGASRAGGGAHRQPRLEDQVPVLDGLAGAGATETALRPLGASVQCMRLLDELRAEAGVASVA